MIISAVPKVQELHQNLEIILGEQNIAAVDFSMTGDIKIGGGPKIALFKPKMLNFSKT